MEKRKRQWIALLIAGIFGGCGSGGTAAEKFVKAERDTAEELCSCASDLPFTLGSVEECIENWDVSLSQEACVYDALSEETDALSCEREVHTVLVECLRNKADCDETNNCLDAYEVQHSRCPAFSSDAYLQYEACLRARSRTEEGSNTDRTSSEFLQECNEHISLICGDGALLHGLCRQVDRDCRQCIIDLDDCFDLSEFCTYEGGPCYFSEDQD